MEMCNAKQGGLGGGVYANERACMQMSRDGKCAMRNGLGGGGKGEWYANEMVMRGWGALWGFGGVLGGNFRGFWGFWRRFWGSLGNFGAFWGHFGGLDELSRIGAIWGFLGVILGSFWGHFWVILGLLWGHFRSFWVRMSSGELGPFGAFWGVVLGLFWGSG